MLLSLTRLSHFSSSACGRLNSRGDIIKLVTQFKLNSVQSRWRYTLGAKEVQHEVQPHRRHTPRDGEEDHHRVIDRRHPLLFIEAVRTGGERLRLRSEPVDL